MKRILLVIEEFQELSTLQSLLLKFGWEVSSVKRDILVREELVHFAPEVVIATAKGRNIDGLKLVEQVSGAGQGTHIFLIVQKNSELKAFDSSRLEGFFTTPIDPKAVIRALARLSKERQQAILEKYEKIFGEPMEAQQTVVATGPPSSREAKYKQWISSVDSVEDQPWGRERVVENLRKDEINPKNDEDRQAFVKRLFGKG